MATKYYAQYAATGNTQLLIEDYLYLNKPEYPSLTRNGLFGVGKRPLTDLDVDGQIRLNSGSTYYEGELRYKDKNLWINTGGTSSSWAPVSTASVVSAGYTLEAYYSHWYLGSISAIPDNDSLYFGSYRGDLYDALTAGLTRVYIPKTGTVKKIYYFADVTNICSNEASDLYFENNGDGGGATLITNSLVFSQGVNTGNNTSLNISVTEGRYFEMRLDTPTFTTNPTVMYMVCWLYIE